MSKEIVIDTEGLRPEMVQFLCKLRDKNKCQIKRLYPELECKNYDNISLEVHHIVAKKDGGDDSPENLITLCTNHHDMAQTKIIPTKLDIIMQRHGIRQIDLAGAMQVTQSAISQIIRCNNPTVNRCVEILEVVNALSGCSYNIKDVW